MSFTLMKKGAMEKTQNWQLVMPMVEIFMIAPH